MSIESILNGLQHIDINNSYAKWLYKGYGIGEFTGYIRDLNHATASNNNLLRSNRLVGQFKSVPVIYKDDKWQIDGDKIKISVAPYIVSLTTGLVQTYNTGAQFDVSLYCLIPITLASSEEDKQKAAELALINLLDFIDRKVEEV